MDDPKKQLESLINKGFNRKAGTINLTTMKTFETIVSRNNKIKKEDDNL